MAATVTPDTATEPAAPERESSAQAPAPMVRVGELVSAACALLLVADLFVTKWYGVAAVPDPSAARPAISTAENGWDGLTIVRWVALAAIVAALGTVVLHFSQRGHGTKTDTGLAVTGLGSLAAALLIYRVLIELPSPAKVIDQKLGAVLGVLFALGIAWGGLESVREQRSRAGAGSRPRPGRRPGRRPRRRAPIAAAPPSSRE
jgi:hypothetical protein